MPQPDVTIQLGPDPHPLEKRAASELKRYIRLLFGFTPPLRRTLPRSGRAICVGTSESNEQLASYRKSPRLPQEGYVVRRRRAGRVDVCDLVGGSPAAVQWAVYEAVAHWGVTYLVQGDVLPDPASVGPFRLPKLEVKHRPVFETRCFRIVNDMLNSGVLWSRADHERLFDQLVKLRFNTVYAATYPHQPWCHWSFRGVERSKVDLVYGFRHVVHERTIGREHFGRLGRYTNPDFQDAESYDQRLAAGRRFMHGIIDAARSRGLRFVLSHTFNDFPEEIKKHLPRWSKKHRIPRSTMAQGDVGTLGLHEDGGNYRFGHLMTPLNPVFVEMVESWLAVHLAEYRQVDGVHLAASEFPPSAGGIEKCWNDLSRRHCLSPKFTLDNLMRRAARQKVGPQEGRGKREALGAVATVRLLDQIVNESRKVGPLLAGKKIYATMLSDALLPVLPHVFDHDQFEFIRAGDYLTARVAEHMDRMAFAKGSTFRLHQSTTINDDNVGFLPQFNTSILQGMTRAMRRHGVKGYWFRQFDISAYEPVMAVLAEAGWDRSATARKSYTRQIERICGEAAREPMLKAFFMLERSLEDANAVIGTGFMMPRLISKFWTDRFYMRNYGEIWQKLILSYAAIEPHLQRAESLSEPRGRQYASDVLAFVRFARLFLQTAIQVEEGRTCYDAAQALKKPSTGTRKKAKPFDLDGYNSQMRASAHHLATATDTLERATRIWADRVRDPTDRGSLLGLNVYGLDWLRGKADEVRMQSEHWGLEI